MKTTIASKFPKALILAFEKGTNFIPGIRAQPINRWAEAIEVKNSLIKDVEKAQKEGRETFYKTIVVDTGDIAYDLCEAYIVNKEGVNYLDETEQKRGYKATSREFDKFFQEIVKAGYTLIVISHSTVKQIKENGKKYEKIIPTISDRGLLVISRLVDVIGYAHKETDEETGITRHVLTLKGDKYLEAGTRNPYLPDEIPLTYEALSKAMASSIDKIMEEDGAEVVEEGENPFSEQTDIMSFEDTMEEIKKNARILFEHGKKKEYEKIVIEYLGRNHNVKDCTEQQIDQMYLILNDLKEFIKENIDAKNDSDNDFDDDSDDEDDSEE